MVMSPNSIDIPPVIWGCQYAGGIVVPVNPAQSAADLHYLIVKSRAKALVVHRECIEIAAEALRLAHLSSEYLLALETNSYGIRTVRQLTEEIPAMTNETARFTPVSPTRDLAYLVYSSGTTGRPKGVMISHRNVVSAILLQSRVEGPHVDWRKDRTLAVLPVYHIYGESPPGMLHSVWEFQADRYTGRADMPHAFAIVARNPDDIYGKVRSRYFLPDCARSCDHACLRSSPNCPTSGQKPDSRWV